MKIKAEATNVSFSKLQKLYKISETESFEAQKKNHSENQNFHPKQCKTR